MDRLQDAPIVTGYDDYGDEKPDRCVIRLYPRRSLEDRVIDLIVLVSLGVLVAAFWGTITILALRWAGLIG